MTKIWNRTTQRYDYQRSMEAAGNHRCLFRFWRERLLPQMAVHSTSVPSDKLLGKLFSEVKVAQSCLTLCDPMDYTVHRILQAGILEWVAFPFSGGIFPTQGSNLGLPHCRWIPYQLSHKRSPTILEWVAFPFSSRSSQPRNRTRVSCIAGRFFTNWAIGDGPNSPL